MRWERAARAKINLALAVTGRREDGYHELESIFLRVGLADRLAMTAPEPAMSHDVLVVTGDPACPVDGNLVTRATALLRQALGGGAGAHPGLAIALEKAIPVAAGMAGGSSDAAAALSLAIEAWGVDLSRRDLMELAGRLGADVPFFAADLDAALVRGVGEVLEPLPPMLADGVGFLLVTLPIALPTGSVFAAFDGLPPPGERARHSVAEVAAAFREGIDADGLQRLAPVLAEANDLWPAAIAVAPHLASARGSLSAALGKPMLMSGSGSTLVAIHPSIDAAAQAGQRLVKLMPAQIEGARIAAIDDRTPSTRWRFP